MTIRLCKTSSPSPNTIPISTSYCLPGMSPYMTKIASSPLSFGRIKTRFQFAPLTLTESPLPLPRASRASESKYDLEDVKPGKAFSGESSSSEAEPGVIPREARLVSVPSEEQVEERTNVVETDVISRTVSRKRGDQGRMECQ